MRGIIIVTWLALAGCTRAPESAAQRPFESAGLEQTPPQAAPSTATDSAATPVTRYRAGDFVTYRYSGTFSEHPVELREEVVEQRGSQLRIRVTAERGGETRRWVQVLTDTPANRKNNALDELFEETDQGLVKLANENNRDLLKLYAWTLPHCDGPPKPAAQHQRSLEIASSNYDCSCEVAEIVCGGVRHQMESCECPRFLWTHASGSMRSLEDDSVLWQMEVLDAGNQARESQR